MLLRRDFIQYLGLVGIVRCGPLDLPGQTSKQCAINLATPPAKFDSSHNYFMRGNDERVRGLVVTVEVEKAIVAPGGISFQLNVQSPKNPVCYWQQYTMGVNPIAGQGLQIGWTIENWGTADYINQLIAAGETTCRPEDLLPNGLCKSQPVINAANESFAHYPDVANDTIPAGFTLRFQLLNDDAGTITAAKFKVIQKGGKDWDGIPEPLASDPLFRATHPKQPVPEAVLRANAGFQMNIVGYHRKETTHLSSGAGKIIYESETLIHPVGDFPGATPTGEQSNIRYSELSADPKNRIVQKFGLDLSPKADGYGASPPNCSGNEVYNPTYKKCMPPTGTTKDRNKY